MVQSPATTLQKKAGEAREKTAALKPCFQRTTAPEFVKPKPRPSPWPQSPHTSNSLPKLGLFPLEVEHLLPPHFARSRHSFSLALLLALAFFLLPFSFLSPFACQKLPQRLAPSASPGSLAKGESLPPPPSVRFRCDGTRPTNTSYRRDSFRIGLFFDLVFPPLRRSAHGPRVYEL